MHKPQFDGATPDPLGHGLSQPPESDSARPAVLARPVSHGPHRRLHRSTHGLGQSDIFGVAIDRFVGRPAGYGIHRNAGGRPVYGRGLASGHRQRRLPDAVQPHRVGGVRSTRTTDRPSFMFHFEY